MDTANRPIGFRDGSFAGALGVLEAQRLAGVGSWIWELQSDTVTWSDELHHLAGGGPAQVIDGFQGA
jgi:hypothetical protein